MAKKPDPSAALRSLLAEPGSLDDVWDDLLGKAIGDRPNMRVARALIGVKEYDDRSAVLVFGAMLDQHLEQAIGAVLYSTRKRTKKLFAYDDKEGGGVLSTFAAKIKMGHALGLYGDEMLDDLELIKLIRNVFAHARVSVDFKHSAVAEACDAIRSPEQSCPKGPASRPSRQGLRCDNDNTSSEVLRLYRYDVSLPEPVSVRGAVRSGDSGKLRTDVREARTIASKIIETR